MGSGNTHVFPTLLNDKVPYDPVRDYAPITNFMIAPTILVAHPSFPPKTIPELIAHGKANPGKINWASSGNGSGGHGALVLFAKDVCIKVQFAEANRKEVTKWGKIIRENGIKAD